MKNLLKKIFLILSISSIGFISLGGPVHAKGISVGTNIIHTEQGVSISYQNLVGQIQPTINQSTPVTLTVQAVYGLEITGNINGTLNNQSGATVNFNTSQNVINNSNNFVSINSTVSELVSINNLVGTLSNWSTNLPSTIQSEVTENQTASFNLQVFSAENAQNNGQATVTLSFTLEANVSPTGAYTGFNDISYGGESTVNIPLVINIEGPNIIILNRSLQIIAPTINSYAGNENDLVPGSKLLVSIVIQNNGSADSGTLNITESIEPHTQYFTDQPHQGTGSYTRRWYFIDDSNSSVLPPESPVVSSVNAIEWIYPSLSTNEIVTLNYITILD